MSASTVRVRNSRRFGIVPDHILENKNLSLEARAVAAWLAGRQDGFEIRVEAMQRYFLGITEKRWKSIRKELEAVGWWRSSRKSGGVRGRFVWSHEFSDEGVQIDSSILPFGMDGDKNLTIPPFGMDGPGMDAGSRHASGAGNHVEVVDHGDYTTTHQTNGGGGEINEMVEAAFWQQSQTSPPANPSAWRASVKRRLEREVTEADRETHQKWKVRQVASQRVQHDLAVLRAADSLHHLSDPKATAKGEALMEKIGRKNKKAA